MRKISEGIWILGRKVSFRLPNEMPKGMTFVTMRKKGEYSLGVKTEKGTWTSKRGPDCSEKTVPVIIDDVIRHGDQGLSGLVRTALKSKNSKGIFLDESSIEFGPCVTES